MTHRPHLTAAAAAVAAALALSGCAADRGGGSSAEGDFPAESLTMLVPYDAGGASDLTARTLAAQMEEQLGQSIVVENRSGGAGSVGLTRLSSLPADGYTIGYLPVETVMLGHQGYDIDPADYDLLGQVVSVPATIAVAADSEYQTLEDLVAASQDGQLSVANSGTGSIWEAATTALEEETGAQFNPVPFDGGAPAVTAAVGGQVDAVVAGVSETSPALADGRLRVLAVLADEPTASLPDVPTARELGYDVVIGGWGGIGAPAGLPDDVRGALAESVSAAAASDQFTSVIESSGNLAVNVPPAEFQDFYRAEDERFAALFGG